MCKARMTSSDEGYGKRHPGKNIGLGEPGPARSARREP